MPSLWRWANGTGKTLTAIGVTGTLAHTDRVRRALIVAPLSILGVWKQEYEKYANFSYKLVVLTGSTKEKAEQLKRLDRTHLQVVVVNYESLWRMEREFAAWKPDMIVCDESHKIKTPSARASKALHRLGAAARYRMILTGTLITNKSLDTFSQYKFLDLSVFGKNYYQFRQMYYYQAGYGGYTWIPKKHLESELIRQIHSIAFVATKAQCLDLPEYTDITRNIELEPAARRLYDDLMKDCIATLGKGEVTATNILTQLLRLQQCTGGYLTDDDGGRPQRVSSAKLDALSDILDTALAENQKLVIIARFIPELEAIRELVEDRNVRYSIITGEIKDRDEQVRRFQEDPKTMVFIGQIATAGLGITLVAASTMVFYSLDFSMANYEQCRARIHRVGQKHPCTYIHLIAGDTVDEKALKALKDKADLAKAMIDDYRAGNNPFQ